MTDDEVIETACPAMGTMGIHSDSYYDEGRCEWCGAKGPIEEDEEESNA